MKMHPLHRNSITGILRLLILSLCIGCAGYAYCQDQVQRPVKKTAKKTTKSAAKKSGAVKSADVSTPDGYDNGHGYVDLGLPSGIKWAYCNIGTESPAIDGDRFAWAEVEPKTSFSDNNYKYVKVEKDGSMVYSYPHTTNDGIHDAAHHKWGGNWRIPTQDEWAELCQNCNVTLVSYKGAKGLLFTSKSNGKSLFLTFAGTMFENKKVSKDSGDYWSSSTGYSSPLSFYFYPQKSYNLRGCSSANPALGNVIRPVCY